MFCSPLVQDEPGFFAPVFQAVQKRGQCFGAATIASCIAPNENPRVINRESYEQTYDHSQYCNLLVSWFW